MVTSKLIFITLFIAIFVVNADRCKYTIHVFNIEYLIDLMCNNYHTVKNTPIYDFIYYTTNIIKDNDENLLISLNCSMEKKYVIYETHLLNNLISQK